MRAAKIELDKHAVKTDRTAKDVPEKAPLIAIEI